VELLMLFSRRPATCATREVLITSRLLLRGKLPVQQQRQVFLQFLTIHRRFSPYKLPKRIDG
jgi:hypothetical protein